MLRPQSLHKYVYAENNPIGYIDISGFSRKESIKNIPSEDVEFWNNSAYKRCELVRDIVEYEREHGTRKAALTYNNTHIFESDETRWLVGFDNAKTPTTLGYVDLDWFTEINRVPGASGWAAEYVYAGGKSTWNFIRWTKGEEYAGLFEDPGELRAVELTEQHTSFSQLFPEEYLSQVCGANSQ